MNAAKITVSSPAFQHGGPIPKKYTGEGADLSPPLAWSGVPAGAKELVLIVDDPDAPTDEPWVHWVLYNLPPTLDGLPEGIAPEPAPARPAGAQQGKNSWTSGRTIGYRGPMPPPGHGLHHYHFKLHALDVNLKTPPGLSKKALLEKIEGHVIGLGELVGTYARK